MKASALPGLVRMFGLVVPLLGCGTVYVAEATSGYILNSGSCCPSSPPGTSLFVNRCYGGTHYYYSIPCPTATPYAIDLGDGSCSVDVAVRNNYTFAVVTPVLSGTSAQWASHTTSATAVDICYPSSLSSNYYCASLSFENRDTFAKNYFVTSNGAPYATYANVQPGGIVSIGPICGPNPILLGANWQGVNMDWMSTTNQIWGASSTNSSPTMNTYIDAAGSGTNYLGAVYNGPITNINWGTNIEQGGFSALYDALAKLTAAVQGQGTNSPGIINGATNVINAATNVADESQSFSNNVMSKMAVPSSATNATAATSGAEAVLGGVDTSIETQGNGFGSGPSLGAGSSSGMSFEFMGTTLDLDPDAMIPGVMAMVKAMWTMVLLAGFALSAGKLLWEATQTYAQAQTGGVPDADFMFVTPYGGAGGNFIGIALAFAIPAAFIALWTGLFSFFVTGPLNTYLGQVSSGVSGFNLNGNVIALYLLNASFPISLFFGLLITRISMNFLAAKIVLVAASASRFLFGH